MTAETRTPEQRAERERQQAEQYMQNLRDRGLIQAPAAPRPNPFVQALRVQEEQPDAALFASEAQLAAWAAAPATMTDAEHDRYCQGGHIMQPGMLPSRPCSRCAAQAQEANLRARLIAAGVDGRYLDYTWDDLEQPAPLDRLAAACARISEIIDAGQSVLIWSAETGSGKTQAAMLAGVAAVRAGRTAHVTNLARLAVEIRDGYGDKTGGSLKEGAALSRLTSPDLLVIDDLGAGETDSASVERRLLFLALDQRQMHRRPTIVTSNLSPQEMAGVFGARIVARLQPLTIIHVNHGKNFRSPKGMKVLW